ncbi:MAG: TylF/MycF/NovP-related O-methyltransferase [Patescibacteria group bacterium]|nr:TylF/MycF/NovP-related O-methyltransferase [Patescibacteria group bacterium]
MTQLVIWGTGVIARRVMDQLKSGVEVIGFVDNDPKKAGTEFCGRRVHPPNSAALLAESDYILLALQSYAQDVYEQLTLGTTVDPAKILFLGNCWDSKRIMRNYRILADIIKYDETRDEYRVHPSNFFLHRGMECDRYRKKERPCAEKRLFGADYTRFRTFELCADELRRIKGDEMVDSSVAEVGVFRGEFAALINAAFPEKRLYLFDTFEGFDKDEYFREQASEGVDAGIANCFRDTSVDLVLARMPHGERCVVRKGRFPDTAAGLEKETFCFVSIDVDLYEPIYNSLAYFYPRLVTGGYLFIHEYNHGHYTGVKKAVERYEAEIGFIRKLPLADNNGTLIVIK